MAYIQSFTVRGLAGRDVTLRRTLDRHMNVFWGLNGTGKTTLLRLLNAAMLSDSSAASDLAFSFCEVTIVDPLRGLTIERRFVNPNTAPTDSDDYVLRESVELGEDWLTGWTETTATDSSEPRWKTRVIGDPRSDNRRLAMRYGRVPMDHAYLPISRIPAMRPGRYNRAISESERARGIASPDEQFARIVQRRWAEYSNRSLNRIRDVQQQGLASVLAILFGGSVTTTTPADAESVDARTAFVLVQRFLEEQQLFLAVGEEEFMARYEESPQNRSVVAEIQSVRQLISVIQQPEREFQRVIEEMYLGNKHLAISTGGETDVAQIGVEMGDQVLPLKSLSCGEKQLLQILLEALAARSATLMIDEPELSLHVDWQRELMTSISRINPDCQVLAATHSPEILSDIEESKVFEL